MIRALLTGLSALRANPLRTILSTLGVIIGVAALVAILALGDGLERFSRDQLERTTDLHTVTVSIPTTDRVDGILVRRDRLTSFSRADLDDLMTRLDHPVAGYRLMTGATAARPPDSTRDVGVLVRVLDPDAPIGDRTRVLHGSLDRWRTSSEPTPAVLSGALAAAFFPGDPRGGVGRTLILANRTLHVVAVLEGLPSDRPLEVYVPMTEGTLAWMAAPDRLPSIMLRADRIEDVAAIVDSAENWAARRFPGQGVSVQSSRARVQQASQAMLVFKVGLGSIAAISLLVGGIGIMNILLASVSERTREIGVRKAAGARSRDILLQFLAESVTIAGTGSLLGIIVGMAGAVAATAIIRTVSEAPVYARFTWPSIAVAAGAAIVVGLVFGTYPARRAARLSPMDAIRHE